ncbi:MAG: DUF3021 family protein [Eubacteriales bacterium]
MLKKIKESLSLAFCALGILTFVFLVLNYIFPQTWTINLLRLVMSVVLIGSVCGAFIFKTGVTPKSLWLRRSIMMGICCLTSVILAYLFDVVTDFKEVALYGLRILILTIIASPVAFLIADKIEKQNLQKINDKLKQINDK